MASARRVNSSKVPLLTVTVPRVYSAKLPELPPFTTMEYASGAALLVPQKYCKLCDQYRLAIRL